MQTPSGMTPNTVASQLDALGLCSSPCLAALRDYCQNRDRWFEAIADHHSIPLRTPRRA